MNNKVNIEEALRFCSAVFFAEDYNDFLNVIEGREEEISKIDLSPITNYSHNGLSVNGSEELLSFLYQHIKYYLEKKNMYTPKLQEGIALCASKVVIIGSINPNRITGYIDSGDRDNSSDKSNPFEEISRMLLISLREQPSLNFSVEKQNNLSESIKETKILFEITKTALNKEKSESVFEHFEKGNIAQLIGNDLERSNINSRTPLSATKRENGDLLNTQFDRIYEFYQTNIELQVVIGNIPEGSFQERYLTRFQNKLIRAKRNIGVYQKTKRLVKED